MLANYSSLVRHYLYPSSLVVAQTEKADLLCAAQALSEGAARVAVECREHLLSADQRAGEQGVTMAAVPMDLEVARDPARKTRHTCGLDPKHRACIGGLSGGVRRSRVDSSAAVDAQSLDCLDHTGFQSTSSKNHRLHLPALGLCSRKPAAVSVEVLLCASSPGPLPAEL